ncbi:3-isopropylmalate/(R)-2-methylmalate dehydratase small subunit [Bradyrhizobium japonicum]|uniref:LeuD/DmdB family oxidoreductase small subunit n=1 Tax=Bradyrhizobium japonicum TaxID=375 RepID=UPI0021686F21|nr:alpha-IPM isomerase [Bradyrhizobium japonicum]MCS3494810.1 3-isopropylmalate/(R)-2-methylmalate dehydratase small subunit [Bradyrhizobium japonicum]MCS3963030.1 3-isopropylmalate/(R)-2-methylmalate dehydratase small subunit [Bradyrhizobium japonicum]MCS3995343.1 3-isopropylmalate/(R)-2-methylmalate dehydratase small subunit [Bradyrhizobium japonicum]
MTALRGRARLVGDDVNTDSIISSTRKRESLDPAVLRQFLFEHVDPTFAASVQPGDILVAGNNFGCGSAMEVAVTTVLGAGIPAVLARSFSRTYYRNAINNGLLPLVCETGGIREGDILISDGTGAIRNERSGETLSPEPLPPIMLAILRAGGLVPYMRQNGDFKL